MRITYHKQKAGLHRTNHTRIKQGPKTRAHRKTLEALSVAYHPYLEAFEILQSPVTRLMTVLVVRVTYIRPVGETITGLMSQAIRGCQVPKGFDEAFNYLRVQSTQVLGV